MIIITSPAKTLNWNEWQSPVKVSQQAFPKEVEYLAQKIKKMSKPTLQKVMKISEKKAQEVYEYYHSWDEVAPKPAILAYDGDIFKQLERPQFTKKEYHYLRESLWILSGLYGAVNAFTKIYPYRLEMKTPLKLKETNNLAEFWQDKVTSLLNKELASHTEKVVLNAASNEYVKAVDRHQLKYPFKELIFKQQKAGKNPSVIGIYAKQARGQFINWCAQNQIEKLSEVHKFDAQGYKFVQEIEDGFEFVREV